MSDEKIPQRVLRPGQSARIRVWDRATRTVRTVFESRDRLYEAPNWTTDGQLLVNGDGKLWLLPVDGPADGPAGSRVDPPAPPRQIHATGLPDVNNDHVLAPDGATMFASANDWHIWEVPLAGGAARRVTVEDGGMHFLHGVSPDGQRLGYVRLQPEGDNWWASATIHTVGLDGQDDVAVTTDPARRTGASGRPTVSGSCSTPNSSPPPQDTRNWPGYGRTGPGWSSSPSTSG